MKKENKIERLIKLKWMKNLKIISIFKDVDPTSTFSKKRERDKKPITKTTNVIP